MSLNDPFSFNIPMPRNAALVAAEIQTDAMRHLMSGEAAFLTLKEAVGDLVKSAPEDHDVVIRAFDILVTEVGFIDPHTLFFRGYDHEGNQTSVVAHYSQLIARVIYIPKRGSDRVITGFWKANED